MIEDSSELNTAPEPPKPDQHQIGEEEEARTPVVGRRRRPRPGDPRGLNRLRGLDAARAAGLAGDGGGR